MKKKKCKESKGKLIINLSNYFVRHKILETANSENQDCSRHPRLKLAWFFFFFFFFLFFFLNAQRGTFFRIPVYERVGVSLVDL